MNRISNWVAPPIAFKTLDPLTPFADDVFKTFKDKLETLLSFFDTSELDDLIDDIQATKTADLDALTDQKKAIDEALADEFDRLNEAYVADWDAALNDAFSAAAVTLSDTDQATLDALKAFKSGLYRHAATGCSL